MFDGSKLRLKKLARNYDPTSRRQAVALLHEAQTAGDVLTGILYVDSGAPTLIDMLKMVDEPLATLPEKRTRPGREALEMAMEELR